MENLVRENIRQLEPYSSARDEFGDVADVYLDANENPYENGYNRYPDPYQSELKRKISNLKEIPTDKIFLGNGSDEILDLVFRAFCEPGQDNVMICPPTYGMYKVLADINNVEIIEVPLNKDFSLDLEGIIASGNANTKLLILCSPNNPTGKSIPNKELQYLLDNMNCIVLVDEAYIDFCEKESATTLLRNYPNLIVSQTFSKAWAMAGLRVGMAFTDTQIVEVLNRIKPPYNINTISQEAVLKQIDNVKKYRAGIENILNQKVFLKDELNMFEEVVEVFESDANFLLVKFKDASRVFNELKNKGIVVRDRSTQLHCEGCLRITIGTEKENKTLIKNLKEIIR
jgi:histidinol-phosphate aminotransferase